MQNNQKPESSRRIKDMDTRPTPIHVDDFSVTDPNEKWVPGNRRAIRPAKEEDPKKEGNKANVQEGVHNGIEIIHKLIILIIAIAAVAGLVFIVVAIAGTYGIDVGEQFRTFKDSMIP